jgi:hypothetical protein
LADSEWWVPEEQCQFTEDQANSTDTVTRYILKPTGPALEKFETLAREEPIVSTCGGYGMGNSGVRRFEIHASNPERALFLELGQEAPLFDEETIVVR